MGLFSTSRKYITIVLLIIIFITNWEVMNNSGSSELLSTKECLGVGGNKKGNFEISSSSDNSSKLHYSMNA